jgi:hypothetical protein
MRAIEKSFQRDRETGGWQRGSGHQSGWMSMMETMVQVAIEEREYHEFRDLCEGKCIYYIS